ncbi:MAG: DUF4416 family protein [Aminobacterium sp.]|jgi:hypothetical protein|uniref:DUF4416 domain-containing protein n=1 Tax=bioreactor metagenome TaxID=1076179 RepID=A0A645APV5_9ZZZZ|nr:MULTISPECIES: DUF4416 family protein [unclassified Aminobacterium]MDD2205831.1 DUF4416 family protein [Aminobacterium sp.]MDD3425898.1 DUF4416 family protein [Aminobacterium sp.]MDD3706720.1 DUF4416 family protein [Aminobacterium sp.]MDD4228154.1 DUF4416 family protein [Aminobacterium sp.]MDD4550899.1 DUF4416 family protein [Aminobacterium sp.]
MTYPVKLITGVLYPDEYWRLWVIEKVSEMWGEPECISEPHLFDITNYYHDIAPTLYRQFISFKGLRDGGDLVRWKKESCHIEEGSYRVENGVNVRSVNIDPGYINGARLVLASTKDHAHRIYISDGIFAEVTMRYRFKKWVSFDYTFPDFASGRYDTFLSAVKNSWGKEMAERRQNS